MKPPKNAATATTGSSPAAAVGVVSQRFAVIADQQSMRPERIARPIVGTNNVTVPAYCRYSRTSARTSFCCSSSGYVSLDLRGAGTFTHG
jgi:hypothetical protein